MTTKELMTPEDKELNKIRPIIEKHFRVNGDSKIRTEHPIHIRDIYLIAEEYASLVSEEKEREAFEAGRAYYYGKGNKYKDFNSYKQTKES